MSERCELSDLLVDQCACRIHAPQPRVRDSWRTGEYSITARLPARFDSECDACGEAMREGDPIARTDNNEYICQGCAGMSEDKMGKLTYLTVKACQAGGRFWVVQEAVASTALAHPEWDLTVRRSFAEWEDEAS